MPCLSRPHRCRAAKGQRQRGNTGEDPEAETVGGPGRLGAFLRSTVNPCVTEPRSRSLQGSAIDALVLAALKLVLGAWVLHLGFTHVSDDDYARTVIAEQFAQAPKLDPSGTSAGHLPGRSA